MRAILTVLCLFLAPLTAWSGGALQHSAVEDQFARVVAKIKPVAERECARRTSGMRCDFRIILDARSGRGANAHQSLDRDGRPVIRVTRALVQKLSNTDELAFIIAHEAGHHIGAHIARSRQIPALEFMQYASLNMPEEKSGSAAQRRMFELEADAFGAIIARRAGFNAMRGAHCLARMHPPAKHAHATHPPLEDRMSMVRRTLGH